MKEVVLWLLVSILEPQGEIEVERFQSAELCYDRLQDYAAYGQAYRVQPACIHASQPWRRYSPQGPNANELRAKEFDRTDNSFCDRFTPCKKP